MQNLTYFQKYLNKPLGRNNQSYIKVKKNKIFKNETFKSFLRVTKNFDKNILLKDGGKRVKGYYRNSSKNKPLITIITVVLNKDKDLDKTIKSVLFQKYENIEYIIIDGGSKGSVLSKIKKYENRIDYWISQKDDGIFDAYNKGVKLASGDYICFLNVGDYFTEKAISYIIQKIQKEELDIIFGSVKKKKVYSGFNQKDIYKTFNVFPSFVSSFINIKLFKKYGLFNLKYSFYNDYEFIYRLINKKKLKYATTTQSQLITIFDLYGFSSKINIIKKLSQEFKIRINYENIFLVSTKITLKFFKYFFVKYLNPKKFKKYN